MQRRRVAHEAVRVRLGGGGEVVPTGGGVVFPLFPEVGLVEEGGRCVAVGEEEVDEGAVSADDGHVEGGPAVVADAGDEQFGVGVEDSVC